jgi:hypothetical protein
MIKFPLKLKEQAHYSMGECDIVYHVYDAEGNHICNAYNEKVINEFIEIVNKLFN